MVIKAFQNFRINYLLFYKFFAFIPLINLLTLIILILHSFILHNQLPTYSNPDPKDLTPTYYLFLITEIILVNSVIVFPVFSIILFLSKSMEKFLLLKYIMVYILSLGFSILFYRLEYLDIATWILD